MNCGCPECTAAWWQRAHLDARYLLRQTAGLAAAWTLVGLIAFILLWALTP